MRQISRIAESDLGRRQAKSKNSKRYLVRSEKRAKGGGCDGEARTKASPRGHVLLLDGSEQQGNLHVLSVPDKVRTDYLRE